MELPPQPDPSDYEAPSGYTQPCYYDALKAWKDVCLAIIAADVEILARAVTEGKP